MKDNIMDYVHLTNDKLLGTYNWKGKLDLLNIVLIGLAEELPEHTEEYELHRLLTALLSMELSVDEKLEIIEKEYHIPVEDNVRKDVKVMCNLSQGILERGEARGRAMGESIGEAKAESKIILKMYKNGFTLEQIADVTDKGIEEIKAIIDKDGSVLEQ
jgi:predicted transposase YdaD